MVLIESGEFQMGDTFGEGDADELPVHTVSVDELYIDPYEVTNAQYAAALNWAWSQGDLITISSGVVYKYNSGTSYPYCDTTASSSYACITWDGSTFGVLADKEAHPVVQVSWYGAAAYTNWRSAMNGRVPCYDLEVWDCNFGRGYRLPTEAEWEKAARGGAGGHRFPWSDTDMISHARANFFSPWVGGVPSYPYDMSASPGFQPLWGTGSLQTTNPVGFFTGALQSKEDWGWPGSPSSYQTLDGANEYGLSDMAGNVWEWCNDKYDAAYYDTSPSDNPHGPADGMGRVLRGGGSFHNVDLCRVASRHYTNSIHLRFKYVGFRCVVGTR